MVDLNLQKTKTVEENDFYGKYVISPLARGFGYTVGNSLRRALLSSIKGCSPTAVRIEGVSHEYSTIDGILEDVMNILLNVKALKVFSISDEPQVLKIKQKGEKVVKASDIETTDSVDILDPEQVIATLTDVSSKLEMEIHVQNGYNYQFVDDNLRNQVGLIPLDSDFAPVSRVNFSVSNVRVGSESDLDEIQMEIWTKSIRPNIAMKMAFDTLSSVFSKLSEDFSFELPVEKTEKKKKKSTKKETVKKTTSSKKKTVSTVKKVKNETSKKSKKAK